MKIEWVIIILGSFALLLNDIMKHQWFGAFAGELIFIIIFILPKVYMKRRNLKIQNI